MDIIIKTGTTRYQYVLSSTIDYNISASGILIIQRLPGKEPLVIFSPHYWTMVEFNEQV